jgi:hypothetical protein
MQRGQASVASMCSLACRGWASLHAFLLESPAAVFHSMLRSHPPDRAHPFILRVLCCIRSFRSLPQEARQCVRARKLVDGSRFTGRRAEIRILLKGFRPADRDFEAETGVFRPILPPNCTCPPQEVRWGAAGRNWPGPSTSWSICCGTSLSGGRYGVREPG